MLVCVWEPLIELTVTFSRKPKQRAREAMTEAMARQFKRADRLREFDQALPLSQVWSCHISAGCMFRQHYVVQLPLAFADVQGGEPTQREFAPLAGR